MEAAEISGLDELDGQAAADAIVANHAALVEAEVHEFRLAAHWTDLHDPATTPPTESGRVLPGTERSRRSGGDGTPMVREFAAAELACLLGRSTIAASTLMSDAVDVRHRLPALWRALNAGGVRVWQARRVAARTRAVGLSLEQARWVDEQTTPYASSLPWGRFESLVEAKIVEVDPDAAEARRLAAAMERFVATGQSNEHGLKTLVARAAAGDVIYFVAVCDRIAQILELEGDQDPVGARRSKALGLLATPARALALLAKYSDGEDGAADAAAPVTTAKPKSLLPRATLYVHMSLESWEAALRGTNHGVARLEGVGPITIPQVRDVLGHCHVELKPVIDLASDRPVDGYEVPARMREQIHLRTPAEAFPFSGNLSRRKDLDHTTPYLPPSRGGQSRQTRIANLGPLGRTAHRLKTHAPGWRHRQPVPGVFLWRTPHGYWFLVDSTGTHQLGRDVQSRYIGAESP